MKGMKYLNYIFQAEMIAVKNPYRMIYTECPEGCSKGYIVAQYFNIKCYNGHYLNVDFNKKYKQ